VLGAPLAGLPAAPSQALLLGILLFPQLKCTNGCLLFLLSITSQPVLISAIVIFLSGFSHRIVFRILENINKNVLICENNKHGT